MKSLILGLCVIVIPAFSSNTSCPQGGQLSSVVGCQVFDSMLANVSSTSLSSSEEAPAVSVTPAASAFSELLVSPLQAPTAGTVPSSAVSFSAPSFSEDIVIPPSSSFQSIPTTTFTSSLGTSLATGGSLGSIILPSQFNVSLPFGVGVSPGVNSIGNADPSGVPEASSVAMIGAGLVILSLAARKRQRVS